MADGDNEWPAKAPDDRLDYGLDWRDFIAMTEGMTVNSFTIAVEPNSNPSDLVIEQPVNVDGIAKLWVSAGVARIKYKVTCTLHATVPGNAVDLTASHTKTLYVRDP